MQGCRHTFEDCGANVCAHCGHPAARLRDECVNCPHQFSKDATRYKFRQIMMYVADNTSLAFSKRLEEAVSVKFVILSNRARNTSQRPSNTKLPLRHSSRAWLSLAMILHIAFFLPSVPVQVIELHMLISSLR